MPASAEDLLGAADRRTDPQRQRDRVARPGRHPHPVADQQIGVEDVLLQLGDLHRLQRRLQRRQDVPQQIMGQRPGRLDTLLLVGDRGRLHRADPDRQVAVARRPPAAGRSAGCWAAPPEPRPRSARAPPPPCRRHLRRTAPFPARYTDRDTAVPCATAPRPRRKGDTPASLRHAPRQILPARRHAGHGSPTATSTAAPPAPAPRAAAATAPPAPAPSRRPGPRRRVTLPRQRRHQLGEQADLTVRRRPETPQMPRLQPVRRQPRHRPRDDHRVRVVPARRIRHRARRAAPTRPASTRRSRVRAIRSARPSRIVDRAGSAPIRPGTAPRDRPPPAPAAPARLRAAASRCANCSRITRSGRYWSRCAVSTNRSRATSSQQYLRYPDARALRLDQPLGLQEPQLGDRGVGKLRPQLRQHLADAHQRSARAPPPGGVAAAGSFTPGRPPPPGADRR